MSSELIIVTDEKQAWTEHKKEIANFLADLAEFADQGVIRLRPRLKDIYDRKLWKHGGYSSLKEFCEKALNYSRQRFHQILNEEATKKALGFDGQTSNCLTLLSDRAAAELAGLPVSKAAEVINEARRVNPKKKPSARAIQQAKARVIEPEPEEPDPDQIDAQERKCPHCNGTGVIHAHQPSTTAQEAA